MGNYKDKNKSKTKTKRKKGKKFVYRNESSVKEEKINPFEAVSKKKFLKHGKKYDSLINDYEGRFKTNSFIDKRIGENSKTLSYDDKMKLRYKAQQVINMKKKKNKYSLMNDEEENYMLTHKGKNLNEDYDDDEKSDEDFYDKMDNYMEEMDNNKGKMSKKEIIQNIIAKSKALKEEKQKQRREVKDKIAQLDDNFGEISSLLKKRGRTFSKFNDDYDKLASVFKDSQKTHPTDRIKSEIEILHDKEKDLAKLNKKRLINEFDDDESNNNEQLPMADSKKLTKKERIEKLISQRLNKADKNGKEDVISVSKRNRNKSIENDDNEENDHDDEYAENEDGLGSDENSEEDNLSDLNEFNEEYNDDDLFLDEGEEYEDEADEDEDE